MVWQRLRRLVLIGSLAVGWLAASPAPSLACSCAAGHFATDVVFEGRVIIVLEGAWVQERLRAWNQGFGTTVALLAVDQTREGPARPFYTVIGGTGLGDCALHFERGVRYLIYGLVKGFGPLDTNICLGSQPLGNILS
jgi:hypothetical protein